MNRMPVREFRNTLTNKGTAFRNIKQYIFLNFTDQSWYFSFVFTNFDLLLIKFVTRIQFFSFVMSVPFWIFGGGRK